LVLISKYDEKNFWNYSAFGSHHACLGSTRIELGQLQADGAEEQ
jgi:hypothetical protein